MDQNFILLRNHKLFWKLSFKECRELNVLTGVITAKKKEFIYLNSLSNDRLYFLKKGYVKIGHYDKDGNEIITEVLEQGDIFGQLNLEKEDQDGEFAQVIKTDASICTFTVADFEKILEKRPDLAISFTKLVGIKLKRVRNRFWSVIHKEVKERLTDFLLELAAQHNPEGKDEVTIDNFLTHSDIANLIGSTRQTVTTLLNEASQKKLLYLDRQKIIIYSVKELRKFVK